MKGCGTWSNGMKFRGITVPDTHVSCLSIRQHAIYVCWRSCRSSTAHWTCWPVKLSKFFCLLGCDAVYFDRYVPYVFRQTCCHSLQGGSIIHMREAPLRIVNRFETFRIRFWLFASVVQIHVIPWRWRQQSAGLEWNLWSWALRQVSHLVQYQPSLSWPPI
jgi:hypothetical protein